MCTDKTNKAYMTTCNYDCDESPSLSSNDSYERRNSPNLFAIYRRATCNAFSLHNNQWLLNKQTLENTEGAIKMDNPEKLAT